MGVLTFFVKSDRTDQSDGLQPNSNGLQPSAAGLQPTSFLFLDQKAVQPGSLGSPTHRVSHWGRPRWAPVRTALRNGTVPMWPDLEGSTRAGDEVREIGRDEGVGGASVGKYLL